MPESPEDAVLCNELRTQEPSAELMKRAAARIETLSVRLATREREEAESSAKEARTGEEMMQTDALKATEAECAEGRTAPRVSLADIEANIAHVWYFTAGSAIQACGSFGWVESPTDTSGGTMPLALSCLTLCVVNTRNGFSLIGKSAPASPENFDAKLGRKLAYEDAVRQLWPLMGYALREKLHHQENQNG